MVVLAHVSWSFPPHKYLSVLLLKGSGGQHGCRHYYVISLHCSMRGKCAPHTILWYYILQNILVEECYCILFQSRCPKFSCAPLPHIQPHVTQMGTTSRRCNKTAFTVTSTGKEVRDTGWRWCDDSNCCSPLQGQMQFWTCGSVLFVLLPGEDVWAPTSEQNDVLHIQLKLPLQTWWGKCFCICVCLIGW